MIQYQASTVAGLAGSTHRVTELIERRQEEEEAGDLAEVSSVTSEVLIELDQGPDPGRAHSQVSDN